MRYNRCIRFHKSKHFRESQKKTMSTKRICWISHRGESIIAPENTVSAHRLARELGTDGSECDVHLTADKKVIVCHNDTTGMIANRDLNVEGSTFDELRALTVANHNPQYQYERLATLPEIIAELGAGRVLYLELKGKNLELVPAVAEEVRKCGLEPEHCVFISFSAELLKAMKKTLPEYKTLFLTHFTSYATPAELLKALQEMNADGVDAADEPPNAKEYIKTLHDAGMYVAVWTIDFPGAARRFIDYGVDSITSNCAADLKSIIG